MFNLSDRVQHKQTGDVGIVVGYGYRLVDNNYWTTVKVKIISSNSTKTILEDLFSEWLFCKNKDDDLVYFSPKDGFGAA